MVGYAHFASAIAGCRGCLTAVTTAVAVSLTLWPLRGRPVTVAELSIWPAFTSAHVVVCVPWQVIHLPGASTDFGQVIAPSLSSVSVMWNSVTAPVLVTV